MSSIDNQIETILNYLSDPRTAEKGLSPLEANGLFRVTRLARIVHVLRQRGHQIYTVMHRDVTNKTYARYYLTGWSNKGMDPEAYRIMVSRRILRDESLRAIG